MDVETLIAGVATVAIVGVWRLVAAMRTQLLVLNSKYDTWAASVERRLALLERHVLNQDKP